MAILLRNGGAASGQPAAHVASISPVDRAAITRLVDRYFAALNASDTAAIVKLYSDDGVFLQPNKSTWTDKAAIARAYATLFSQSKVEAAAQMTEITLMSPGWAFGRAVATGAIIFNKSGVRADGPTQELFVFKKERGEWRIARFAFSSLAAAPVLAKP